MLRGQELFDQRMSTLFNEVPVLSGFHVLDDLSVAEVAVTVPGWSASSELAEDLASYLADMIDERPEVAELLRGRTFARAVH
jgi:hypothetical protein